MKVNHASDVELALEVLTHAAHSDIDPLLAARAAILALEYNGITADEVDVRLVVMNAAAVACTSGGQAGDTPPFVTSLGLSGKDRHPAVRVGDWLLDLGLGVAASPEFGLTPSPSFARLSPSFWAGSEAAVLAGDDGSRVWAWHLPGRTGGFRPDPQLSTREVFATASSWAPQIQGVLSTR